ncbi:phosphate uptake regulator PhoU [Methanolobus zinderi]|uniref:Phosphate uptake regulator PhoU n=1 Tax=Methanolobus zinderi TaxID=536044 RepID=A0A7D5J8L2_9EURY|nr:phosphate uptake regulator PhoU [Methanolobus zinderi]QLC49770.1 phosphate uptake regulator PhoU [Methanolobus zinderi]
MDTRKVQVTGKSTYIVTIPKKWAVKSRLKSGSPLSILYAEDGSLIIKPPGFKESKKTKKIKTDKKLEHLKRDIIGLYIVGDHHMVEIQGENLSRDFREEIKALCTRLVGFELVESSETALVIQNYLDSDEFTIEKGIKRMSSIIYLMLDELEQAFGENDRLMCKEIIKRDDDIDRMFTLVSRQYVNRLNLKKASSKDALSLIEAFYYRMAGREIERIGDHITKIALHYEYTEIHPDVLLLLAELCGELQTLFMDSFESLRQADNELGNRVLESGEEFDSKLVIAGNMPVYDSIDIIIDSFSRIKDYASNIAEHAIDLSQL